MAVFSGPRTVTFQADPTQGGWTNIVDVLIPIAGIILVIVLVGIFVWQAFQTLQTRMTTQATIARDQEFRGLAERSVAAQEAMTGEVTRLSTEVQEINRRVAAMEKMLRDVG